jgi:oligopeptide transport system substrate-binding protein
MRRTCRKPTTNFTNCHEFFKFNSCKFVKFVVQIFVILLISGCGIVSSSATPPASTSDPFSPRPTATLSKSQSLYGIPREQALVLEGFESTNPREYDPATTHSSGDKLVFSGLVSFDPQLNLVADLAGSWQIANGTIYTFTLRSDARFHNGRPVTAQDVIYSWERAADPKTNSDTVLTYLGDIVGVKEMHAGQAKHIAGLQAIDDHTLQVTIDAPKPYFLLKLTYPTAFVVDRANVESRSEWYRTPNGAGPYRLARWDKFKVMLYERNDDYYLEPPAIPYVVVQLFSGVGLRLYETNEIDITGVAWFDVPRVLDQQDPLHADLVTGVNLCTSFITFDVDQPPFDDPIVRQAFTLAFDRQKYLDVVLGGIGIPANGLYPPGLPGFNTELKGPPYDPAQARQLLGESKYGSAENLPPIVYTGGGIGSDVGRSISAMAQMWQQNLGVTLTIENLDPDKYLDQVDAGHHGQIFSGGWCADYPDPENFADALFHTGAQQNRSHYSNPQLDALLEQARIEPNVTTRMQLYQQAEQIIVNDAPVVFTVHSISYTLVKPYVHGYVETPIAVPLERYLSLVAGS